MNIREQFKLLRIVRILSNLKHLKSLRANKDLYKKLGIDRHVWLPLSHAHIPKLDAAGPWLDDEGINEEHIRSHPSFQAFPQALQEQLIRWNTDGFLIIPGFFKSELIDAVEESLTDGLNEEEKKNYHGNRLLNSYRSNKAVETLFRDVKLLDILSFLLGKDVHPFQTINFYRSSSQHTHSDAVHLTTAPLGYSVGVWVALEDVKQGSGEFFIYPGSHRLPYILNDDFGSKSLFLPTPESLHKKYDARIDEVLRQAKLEKKVFQAAKGDILIWHTNLLHGSLPKTNSALTRKSQVMHYFAKGVLCYHEMIEKPAVLS